MIDFVLTSIAFGIGIISAFLVFYYLWKDYQKQSKTTNHVDRIENGPDEVHNKGDASNEIPSEKKEMPFLAKKIGDLLRTSSFLVIWVIVQWLINQIIQLLQPSGSVQLILATSQVIFAIVTLIPILLYYYVDIRIMMINADRMIQQEAGKGPAPS